MPGNGWQKGGGHWTHPERRALATSDPEAYMEARKRWRAHDNYRHHKGWRSKNPTKLWTQRKRQNDRYLKVQEAIAGRPKPDACEMCGTRGMVVFDHDHSNEQFRGWLCQRCNTILGMAKDNPDLLELLALYLRSFQ